jgi:hypothetical protein
MTTEVDILVRQFEAYGPDAPFFAEVANRRMEAESSRDLLTRLIAQEVQIFVDDVWPKPVFVRPNQFSLEEDLDVRIMRQDARQYVDAKIRAYTTAVEPIPSAEIQKDWFDARLDHLARLYCNPDELPGENDTIRANAVARNLLADFEIELAEDLPLTGHAPTDLAQRRSRESDRAVQQGLEGTNFVYFGHTNSIHNLLYEALLRGYNPTPEQLKAEQENGGHNFLWDEISELHHQHADVHEVLNRFGYGSEEALDVPLFVGAYAVPRDVIIGLLTTLYLRGQSYKEEGMGFPWLDDVIVESADSVPQDDGAAESGQKPMETFGDFLMPPNKWSDEMRQRWGQAVASYYAIVQSYEKQMGSNYDFTDDSEISFLMILQTAVNLLSQAYGFKIENEHVRKAGGNIMDEFFEEADEAFIGPDAAKQLLQMAVRAAKQLQRYAEITS